MTLAQLPKLTVRDSRPDRLVGRGPTQILVVKDPGQCAPSGTPPSTASARPAPMLKLNPNRNPSPSEAVIRRGRRRSPSTSRVSLTDSVEDSMFELPRWQDALLTSGSSTNIWVSPSAITIIPNG